MEKILEVLDVELFVLENHPPKLRISASGNIPGEGWTNPRLEPFVFIQPPPDGIYDFDFVADPPHQEPATDAITPIGVVHLWDPLPPDAKGVRIHVKHDSKKALLGNSEHPERNSSPGNSEHPKRNSSLGNFEHSGRNPSRFTFIDHESVKRVVFFPQALGPLDAKGKPQEASLEYTGPEGHFVFRGAQITQQQTVMGALISVNFRSGAADEPSLDFALVLPPVELGEELRQDFKTMSILIQGCGFVVNHPGAQLTYKTANLEGIAEYIPVL
ncbi:MAG: hypothetical protein ABS69_04870 [Nitrosomonadales bacterium SCN 54-20]|nr:MAG: hypothetical protein ABS69_04870 [Nitrosomonadales bacterium SCN 54-20]